MGNKKEIKSQGEWIKEFLRACLSGDLEVVRVLCSRQYGEVESLRQKGAEGLGYACQKGHLEIVRFLTTSKDLKEEGYCSVDLHANAEYGLRAACYEGHLEVVKFLTTSKELVEAGHSFADLSVAGSEALSWAAIMGKLEIIKFLTKNEILRECGQEWVDIQKVGNRAFQNACQFDYEPIVKFVIEEDLIRWDQNLENLEEGLRLACEKGHLNIVKYLTLSEGVIKDGIPKINIHTDHDLGFQYACQNGNVEVVRFLTTSQELKKAGHTWVDIHHQADRGFKVACEKGEIEIVKFLVEGMELRHAGQRSVNPWDHIPSWKKACVLGRMEVVKFLIEILRKQAKNENELLRVEEEGFLGALSWNRREILKWMILEGQWKQTESIQKAIKNDEEVKRWFEVQLEEKELEKVLKDGDQDIKRVKARRV